MSYYYYMKDLILFLGLLTVFPGAIHHFREFVANRKKRRINSRMCTYRNERLLSVASVRGPHTRVVDGRAPRCGRREPTYRVDWGRGGERPSS